MVPPLLDFRTAERWLGTPGVGFASLVMDPPVGGRAVNFRGVRLALVADWCPFSSWGSWSFSSGIRGTEGWLRHPVVLLACDFEAVDWGLFRVWMVPVKDRVLRLVEDDEGGRDTEGLSRGRFAAVLPPSSSS